MGDLYPVIEGPVKFRDGKKVRTYNQIAFKFFWQCYFLRVVRFILLTYFMSNIRELAWLRANKSKKRYFHLTLSLSWSTTAFTYLRAKSVQGMTIRQCRMPWSHSLVFSCPKINCFLRHIHSSVQHLLTTCFLYHWHGDQLGDIDLW